MLLVTCDESGARYMEAALAAEGIQTASVPDVVAASGLLRHVVPDLIVVGGWYDRDAVLAFVDHAGRQHWPTLVLTGSPDMRRRSIALGALAAIAVPSLDAAIEAVHQQLK